ncbi:hypothetical protein B296_00049597 [Ensete ventricosum]|uniref:Uncharacterized protein n=1 Tax=Ensete ventricosum TaxID=4639 RepID=A0A426WY40_ENSVE|nr:hypothetical protein B296_00049597 [Ensete ventricosum]
MANTYVKRVMIDTKSSADILYFDAFQKLRLTHKDLVTLMSTLTGFTGEFVSPVGATVIPVMFGGEPRSKTLMVSFMVVKLSSAYNAIIGHPTLNRLKVVVLTNHRHLKFPTRVGVGEVRSDPRESRQRYLAVTTLSKKPKTQSAAVVPQNPEDSTRDPHTTEQVLESLVAPIRGAPLETEPPRRQVTKACVVSPTPAPARSQSHSCDPVQSGPNFDNGHLLQLGLQAGHRRRVGGHGMAALEVGFYGALGLGKAVEEGEHGLEGGRHGDGCGASCCRLL